MQKNGNSTVLGLSLLKQISNMAKVPQAKTTSFKNSSRLRSRLRLDTVRSRAQVWTTSGYSRWGGIWRHHRYRQEWVRPLPHQASNLRRDHYQQYQYLPTRKKNGSMQQRIEMVVHKERTTQRTTRELSRRVRLVLLQTIRAWHHQVWNHSPEEFPRSPKDHLVSPRHKCN